MTGTPPACRTEPGAELVRLRRTLTDLADWAVLRLDDEHYGRQFIAEHLLDCLTALASGQPLPDAPF